MSTPSPERRETAALRTGAQRPSLWRHDAAAVVLVALSYFAGTKLGFDLTSAAGPISFFWPPNAILLAALLLVPVRLWWACLLALTPLHFLAQAQSGVPLATAFGWLVGNAGEALLGATLIVRLAKRAPLFDSAHGVICFLVFGFALAPLVTSFLDAAIVVGTKWGQGYWHLWITRLLSNMLGTLAIVPLIVVVAQRARVWIAGGPQRIWLEAALMAIAVALVSLFVFRADTFSRISLPALIYLPLPLLLWAAMRFGAAGVSAALLILSLTSMHSLMLGRGPFVSASMVDSAWSMQLFLCMVGVPLILLGAVSTERRQTERALQETSRKLIAAQERERQRIVLELHDDIGQTLTLADIELTHIITEHSPDDAGEHLKKLSDQLTMVSQSVWELSRDLYPSSLELLGLVTALRRLCTDLGNETSLQLHFDTTGVPDRLPADVSLCLYRVAQEALNNIVRHGQATHAAVDLRLRGGRLLLQVADDGVGFDPSMVPAGLGFASMRERLKAVQGGLDIDSKPGRGTNLDAWVTIGRQLPNPTGSDFTQGQAGATT